MNNTTSLTLKRMGTTAIALMLSCVLFLANVAPAYAAAGIISSHEVKGSPFNPYTEFAQIHFYLEEDATVDVHMHDASGTLVDFIVQGGNAAAGPNYVTWYGNYDNSSEKVPEGRYMYVITARGNSTHTVYGYVEVELEDGGNNGGDPPAGTAPEITSDYASPSSFDPTQNETSTINYTLNTTATVVIQILDGNTVIETLSQKTWDGKDSHGNAFAEDTYTYKIVATNSYGTDTETGKVTVDYDEQPPVGDAPEITNAYATPVTFDPSEGEDTVLHYQLNTCADVTVKVYEDGTDDFVRTLKTSVEECNSDDLTWNGRNSSNNVVDEGDYYFKISAVNAEGTDVEYVNVDVEDDGGSSTSEPEITDAFVSPSTFDPSDGEDTTVHYDLNTCAYVTIKVYEEGSEDYVDTLVSSDYQCGDDQSEDWNGRDSDNDIVDEGDYFLRITAVNDDGNDTEELDVEVEEDGGSNNDGPEIQDMDVDPYRFNPDDNEDTELSFEISEDADVTVRVYDDDDDLVVELWDDKAKDEGDTLEVSWDGEDDDNDVVSDGVYYFEVRAENSDGSDEETINVRVDTDEDDDDDDRDFNDLCADFFDVDEDDIYCIAIIYVTDQGIFDGYPDMYFRPEQGINRAETAKVILEGFDIPVDSYTSGYSDFWDVDPSQWYMEYIEEGVERNIIDGYPDGSFQPARTVNRVELLKLFLETSNVYVPNCSYQPYPDTPVQYDTDWYMDYVCFSKQHDLMDADRYGNFNPNAPMSRGDVAELFYRFDRLDLDNYNYNYNNNYDDDPRLTNVELSDDVVDEGESFRIEYRLNTGADITVEILDDDNDVVRELLDDKYRGSGNHSLYFDGEDDDGDDLDEGDYEVRIKARNDEGSDTETVDFEVDQDANDDEEPELTRVDLSDDTIQEGDTFQVEFRLNVDADITVEILDDDNDVVRTLVDDKLRSDGDHTVYFNGNDDDGDDLEEGDYEVRIKAKNDEGSDSETVEFEVDNDFGDSVEITELTINKNTFDPGNESLNITFRIDEEAEVSINVYDDDGDLERELWDRIDRNAGRYTLLWDGEDDDGDRLKDGDYTIRVEAENDDGDDEREIDVEIEN
ncbi:FlgD immunoglobulin-like domain containing protein [Patescibacteria group bacterium]